MIEPGPNNIVVIETIYSASENADIGARRGFHRIGLEMVEYNRKLIYKGPKTGRLYKIPGRKRKHRASAPGEAPANLSGALAKSIGYEITPANEMAFGSRSKDDSKGGVAYGGWLDGGTKRIKPRPHVSRTAAKFEPEIETRINEEQLKLL
jgi:hypothetical protein